MYPILLRVGPFTIHTYGALVALGFLAAITLASSDAKRRGMDPQKIMDLGLYLIVAGIVGARLLDIAIEYRFFAKNPLEMFMIWKGGLVFYGGFIAAVPTAIWYLKKNDLPVWKVGDVLAPCLALGHAIGRLGCFAAGCCYGCEAHLPWSVTFTDPDSLAILGVPLHPTQIYEALGNFILFFGLWAYRKKTVFDGQLFWLYVMLYSVLRFLVEAFRGDSYRGHVSMDGLSLSTSQSIGVVTFLVAAVMLSRLRTVSRRKAHTEGA